MDFYFVWWIFMAKKHLKKNVVQTCQYKQKSQNNSSPIREISKKLQVRIAFL